MPFVQEITLKDPSDFVYGLKVAFSGPAAGNQAVAVTRNVTFDLNHGLPLTTNLIEALVEKYGAPSFEGMVAGRPLLTWLYQNGSAVKCRFMTTHGPEPICHTTYENYDFGAWKDPGQSTGYDQLIQATIETDRRDPTSARSMRVSMNDLDLMHKAGMADFSSLAAQWEKAKSAAPAGTAPKL